MSDQEEAAAALADAIDEIHRQADEIERLLQWQAEACGELVDLVLWRSEHHHTNDGPAANLLRRAGRLA